MSRHRRITSLECILILAILALCTAVVRLCCADIFYYDNVTSLGTADGVNYYDLSGGGGGGFSYVTDTNVYQALWEMETTNSTQTLDTGLYATYHASNKPSVAAGPAWTITSTNGGGRVEHSYSFDASDDVFDPGLVGWAPFVTFSMGCWIKLQATGRQDFLWEADTGTGQNGKMLASAGIATASRFSFYYTPSVGGISGPYTASSDYKTNEWIFFCVTFDNDKYTMYTNGIVAHQTAGSQTSYKSSTYPLYIGSRNGASVLNGEMDHVFVSTGAMSVAAQTNLMAFTHPTNNVRARP